MGKLVRMSDFRQTRRSKRAVGSRVATPTIYYCTKCGTDHFTLCTSGAITCVGCRALMGNIQVSESRKVNNRVE